MKKVFNYECISIQDIENNPHLIFECNGNYKQVIVGIEEENEGE